MTARLDERSIRKIALTALAGTSIEWYDFFLYGTAAALIFPTAFFPADMPPAVALLASFSTFAVGFIARPIGGIIFGHYGDRIGRKNALVVALVLMGAATTLIGCLPSYASIGVAAPILLIVLRFRAGHRDRWPVGRRGAARDRERPAASTRVLRQLCPGRRAGRRDPGESRVSDREREHRRRRHSCNGAGACRSCSASCSSASRCSCSCELEDTVEFLKLQKSADATLRLAVRQSARRARSAAHASEADRARGRRISRRAGPVLHPDRVRDRVRHGCRAGRRSRATPCWLGSARRRGGDDSRAADRRRMVGSLRAARRLHGWRSTARRMELRDLPADRHRLVPVDLRRHRGRAGARRDDVRAAGRVHRRAVQHLPCATRAHRSAINWARSSAAASRRSSRRRCSRESPGHTSAFRSTWPSRARSRCGRRGCSARRRARGPRRRRQPEITASRTCRRSCSRNRCCRCRRR